MQTLLVLFYDPLRGQTPPSHFTIQASGITYASIMSDDWPPGPLSFLNSMTPLTPEDIRQPPDWGAWAF